MTPSPLIRIFLITLTLALLNLTGGCSSFNEGTLQEVTILSYPSGANVSIGGENAGKTPLTVPLGAKIGHEVRISLHGYQTQITDILPQLGDGGRATVQFGFSKQTGSYNELTPNPLIAILKSTDGTQTDPYEVMMSLIEVNDQRFRAGKINRATHKKINEAIIAIFN